MHVSNILQKPKYQQLLEAPEWKDFSKYVRREKGCCEVCKRSDVELQVHHLFYDSTRQPWEYGVSEVAVLCRGCHKSMHEHLQAFRRFVFGKMNPQTFQVLNGALAVAFDTYDPLVFAHAVAELASTPSMVERYAKSWGLPIKPKTLDYDPDTAITKEKLRTEMEKK